MLNFIWFKAYMWVKIVLYQFKPRKQQTLNFMRRLFRVNFMENALAPAAGFSLQFTLAGWTPPHLKLSSTSGDGARHRL